MSRAAAVFVFRRIQVAKVSASQPSQFSLRPGPVHVDLLRHPVEPLQRDADFGQRDRIDLRDRAVVGADLAAAFEDVACRCSRSGRSRGQDPRSASRAWSWVGPTHCPPSSTISPSPIGSFRVRPPTRSRASITATSTPSRLSSRAAESPASPAPTTTTSHSSISTDTPGLSPTSTSQGTDESQNPPHREDSVPCLPESVLVGAEVGHAAGVAGAWRTRSRIGFESVGGVWTGSGSDG